MAYLICMFFTVNSIIVGVAIRTYSKLNSENKDFQRKLMDCMNWTQRSLIDIKDKTFEFEHLSQNQLKKLSEIKKVLEKK